MVDKMVFRREEKPAVTPVKKPAPRLRKDMTPFISLFDEREKSKIVKKIFRNDLSRFNTFMQDLNLKVTWNEVFRTIENEMSERKINMDMEEVRQLTDRIYLIFYPDDISIGV